MPVDALGRWNVALSIGLNFCSIKNVRGGDIHELRSYYSRRSRHVVCADGIHLIRMCCVALAEVYVGLGGKVNDDLRFMFFAHLEHLVQIGDVKRTMIGANTEIYIATYHTICSGD